MKGNLECTVHLVESSQKQDSTLIEYGLESDS